MIVADYGRAEFVIVVVCFSAYSRDLRIFSYFCIFSPKHTIFFNSDVWKFGNHCRCRTYHITDSAITTLHCFEWSVSLSIFVFFNLGGISLVAWYLLGMLDEALKRVERMNRDSESNPKYHPAFPVHVSRKDLRNLRVKQMLKEYFAIWNPFKVSGNGFDIRRLFKSEIDLFNHRVQFHQVSKEIHLCLLTSHFRHQKGELFFVLFSSVTGKEVSKTKWDFKTHLKAKDEYKQFSF